MNKRAQVSTPRATPPIKAEELRKLATRLGYVMRRQDGEFRICVKGGYEMQAYYTDDIDDAHGTLLAMYDESRRRTQAIPDTYDSKRVVAHGDTKC